ncbi:carbon-nitrogen family hydrolase [Aneurinibacillus terranovensis]|uniref:carbon-nitrogen family hydrolase n=1 Tax=Aneurinibacillus terranovensis TaxID=278991 RepID=UPI00041EC63F|nr:carbon-nitrogen family hydrolase [Aneurinibacillus terranovensis]
MKIAVCQMNVVQGDREHNRKAAGEMIDEAAENGAQVVVLPEMWTSGYDFPRLNDHTEQMQGATVDYLAQKALEHKIWIVGGSFPVQYSAGTCNTSITFNPEGKIENVYSKLHLIGLMDEDRFLIPGEEFSTYNMGNFEAATIICYDLRFPELARTYALEGACVIFVPAEWPVQRLEHWRTLLRARAIENQLYVVAANISGRNEHDVFQGHSLVIDPWGEVIAEAGDNPQILYADIEPEKVAPIRERMPVFKDRKPHLYRL